LPKFESPRMSDYQPKNSEEIRLAFHETERDVWIRNFRVASILAFVFVPAGSSLDAFVYPGQFAAFFRLRLICSALLLFIWWFVKTPVGMRHYRLLGWILPALPTLFISLMIYDTDGAESTYYAGLNLVLLGAAIVLRWTLLDSVVVFLEVMGLYLAACLLHGPIPSKSIFFNNVYFLFVTGVFVIIGSYFYNQLRFREFTLRYELDKTRKALEASLQQLKENEMQLVQTEKLASLGRMSAGIIHEINNPLNFAITGLFTLRNKGQSLAPEQQEDYAEVLNDVEEGVKRVKTIVSDLQMFTHPETESRDQVAVAEVVASALRFLSNEWKDKVQIDQQIAGHQTIWVNKNKLIHLVTNLLQNSLDALKTKSFRDEKPTIRIEGRIENGSSILSVRDNGPGIAPADVDKIFDPFFTTKDVGEGMGLGLSICYRIVQESGGRISVKTEPGKFCEFTLEFPVRTNQATN
jgi:two-component system sensor histidine kinase PhcS